MDCWRTGARNDVLTRLDFAERARWQTGATIVVEVPQQHQDDGAAALASGRTHLIHLTETSTEPWPSPSLDQVPA
ncbi:hypothetical protein C5E43_26365 [Nocardia cyriacigeorgica]|nr:hypothetical protein C5E43_26365 [Nocardia cyriacigeorgica]